MPLDLTPVTRASRLWVALVILLVLSAQWWPEQLDDFFITYTYATEWLEQGALQWPGNGRVEGYSNFLWVVLMVPVSALELPPGVVSKLVSFASAAGILALLHRWFPRSAAGTAALLAVAMWSSLDRWALGGLETMTGALLLVSGWVLVLRHRRSWAAGMWLLVLFSLLRPEGAAYVVLGAAARFRGMVQAPDHSDPQWDKRDLWGLAALLLLGGYHLARVRWFGDFWPTPYLVKVAASSRLEFGPQQLIGDGVAALGVIVLAGLTWKVPRLKDLPWVLLPALLQSWLLVRADGDWMGAGRLTLAGGLASLGALAALSPARDPSRVLVGVLSTPALVCAMVLSQWPGDAGLAWRSWEAARPWAALRADLSTPFSADVLWMADTLPDGAVVVMGDVGMPGMVEGVRIIDTNGLVTREVAEWLANRGDERWTSQLYEGDNPVACIRLSSYDSREAPMLDGEYGERYLLAHQIRGEVSSNWFCRADMGAPSEAVVRARWERLAAKFPDQPFIQAQAARWATRR